MKTFNTLHRQISACNIDQECPNWYGYNVN